MPDHSLAPRGSRLTGSTERLAALLRSQVSPPESEISAAETESHEVERVLSGRQQDEHGNYRGAGQRTDQRADIEEIMERLADELETGFVRTYGSSGG